MDKEYWEKYYLLQDPSQKPSDFARFVAKKYASDGGILVDVGCGNGRDTLFFSSQSIEAYGVEQCKVAIEKNIEKGGLLDLGAKFIKDDFSKCDYDSLANGPFSIYSRFTLHAIDYDEEKAFFNNLERCRNLIYLYIEARSIHDHLYGEGSKVGLHEYVTTHYRRFISSSALISRLIENFDLHYFEESTGFAKTTEDDPCLIRLIARRR